MLSRKQVNEIAEIVAHISDEDERNFIRSKFVRFCSSENPRFDATIFSAYIDNLVNEKKHADGEEYSFNETQGDGDLI